MRNAAREKTVRSQLTTHRLDADDPAACAEAAAMIRRGGLVAFATETVYGLGADAANADAVARLYAVKQRPRFNPLIVHAPSIDVASRIGRIEGNAERLAEAFWPGPLTLVVPMIRNAPVADLVTAGLSTVAVRVPGHLPARDFLSACGTPVVAPSANRSGHVSPTTADHVLADLDGRIDAVLDAGPAALGIESTIIGAGGTGPAQLLRPGAVARTDVEAALGCSLAAAEPGAITAPGQLASHYAPSAALRLNAEAAEPDEVLVAFGARPGERDAEFVLSESGSLEEAAARLFTVLRRLDECGIARAAVMPVPGHGLGEAINDRLTRAAAPRPGPGETSG